VPGKLSQKKKIDSEESLHRKNFTDRGKHSELGNWGFIERKRLFQQIIIRFEEKNSGDKFRKAVYIQSCGI
jgi:hypothetical protein